jgi:hypothetical protein
MEGITYKDARRLLYGQVINSVPDSKVVAFRECFLKNKKAQLYVVKRGIEDRIAIEFRLGYDPHTNRIAIPIFDQFLTCVNMRLMAFNNKRLTKHKAINIKGHGEVRLYPEWLAKDEDKLLLVEGEWDCLIGRQLGLPTVTWTGGANAWNHDYDWLLKNKAVMVLYDGDDAGRKGSEEAMRMLGKITHWGQVVERSPLMSKACGKDLNDWYKEEPETVRVFVNEFNQWDPQTVDLDPTVCPCCGRKYED